MENLWLFYWMTTVQSLALNLTALAWATIIFTPVGLALWYVVSDANSNGKTARAEVKRLWGHLRGYWIGCWVIVFALSFIPSQEQMITIILGSSLTSKTAQQLPQALLNYLNKENSK